MDGPTRDSAMQPPRRNIAVNLLARLLVVFLLGAPACAENEGNCPKCAVEAESRVAADAGKEPEPDAEAETEAEVEAPACRPERYNIENGVGDPYPLWFPCGWFPSFETCQYGDTCPEDQICWENRCLVLDTSESGAGQRCLEAAVHLDYGGATPDRIYSYRVELPPMERTDGSPIESHEWMAYHNYVPCIPIHTDEPCYVYHEPVELCYDETGLVASGASAFTLYKIRKELENAVAPTWPASGAPLTVSWGDIRWSGGSGGAGFDSSLSVYLWSTEDGCATRTRYLVPLPLWSDPPPPYEVMPESETFCPQP